jgi:hypothetical protein
VDVPCFEGLANHRERRSLRGFASNRSPNNFFPRFTLKTGNKVVKFQPRRKTKSLTWHFAFYVKKRIVFRAVTRWVLAKALKPLLAELKHKTMASKMWQPPKQMVSE